MKQIVTLVPRCGRCPYIRHWFGNRYASDSEEQRDQWYCTHPVSQGRTLGEYISSRDPIPDWCPLDDAPQQEGEHG